VGGLSLGELIIRWFTESGSLALWISIGLNILISIAGIIPSIFLTAANIAFFGFNKGLLISIAGEAIGAIISFYIYRKGIKKLPNTVMNKHKLLIKLKSSQGIEASLIIIALRIFPFIPSGMVTLAGSFSRIGILSFSIASTIGKIPALLIEAFSVAQVLNWNWQGKLILGCISVIILTILLKKKITNHPSGGTK
jgi:uncharacterized membrane protein YdjX (TVP38/TMEM64 family)